jgi:hydrophobic/amphiphilic exporter-1 (mainly G- bacteria), HAE1 family
MWISDTSIKKPVFATMVILALVVLGIVSYPKIGVDLFPKIDFPIVSITTRLTGASPEIMDMDVTDKLEEAINTINGVKTITSSSYEGASSIIVEFVLEKDIDLAVQDIREQVSAIRYKLPTDIIDPIIQKVDPDANPVLWINVTGNRSVRELSTYVDEIFKDKLQRIEGVGALRIGGMQKRQVRIWLDSNRMRAYQISASEIAAVLGRENMELPGGRIEGNTKEYSVKVKGTLQNVSDFNNLIVAYYQNAPVRIKDIGRAEDGSEDKRSIARFNGIPSVGVGIQKQSGTNTVEVIDRVKKNLEMIKKDLPPGLELNIAFDQSSYIKQSINEVQKHLILGSILAVIAVFVFLRNIRTTLISALALPVSLISTFALIRAFGFTFNNMTMLGLTLSVGILIDDAIIVIENIYRHIEEGMAPKEAASFATSEIGLAVMATTLAIIVIFLPVAFMKGIIGRFFMQFALVVVFSVAVSFFVSLTLTPMLSSLFLKPKQEKGGPAFFRAAGDIFERAYKKVESAYKPVLKFSIENRGTVIIFAILLFSLSIYITRFIGKEFVPQEDQSQFVVRMEAPIDYSMNNADELFLKVDKLVKSMPEVKTTFYVQGMGQGGAGQINKAVIFTRLIPKAERKRNQMEIMKDLRQKMLGFAGLKGTAEDVSFLGGGIRNVPIQYVISGSDLATLKRTTKEIAAALSKVPGIVDVDTSVEAGKPELSIYIDRDKAADLGLSISSIAEAINLLISGDADITKFKDDERGRRYDVRMRLFPGDRKSPQDLNNIYVRAKDGKLVELSSVATIVQAGGPTSIMRVDRQRSMMIYANLEQGKPLAAAIKDLNSISASVLQPGMTVQYKGMAETMGESFKFLIFALILGIILAYMVLAAQFESFMHPVTVLLSMPLSFIGAFGVLLIFGKTISITSMIGLILLMGLVKKNAILLIDYTNTLRERGMTKREALLTAGPIRLRPILMTTFAMVCGMLPVALGVGEGSESRAPMGVAVIGGLITSLFLTLAVVPATYDLFDEWKQRLFKKKVKSGSGLKVSDRRPL